MNSQISEKQLAANRQNAQKGGVKTSEGKSISRYNAIKHGLLSQEVILPHESEKDLKELGKRIRITIKPQNAVELLLVERIIANIWRLKRALRVEREMIEKELNSTDFMGKSRDLSLGGIFQEDFTNYDTFGKFIRYETSIERGIYKALHEIQRIRATEDGGNVLAPIAIDVDMPEKT